MQEVREAAHGRNELIRSAHLVQVVGVVEDKCLYIANTVASASQPGYDTGRTLEGLERREHGHHHLINWQLWAYVDEVEMANGWISHEERDDIETANKWDAAQVEGAERGKGESAKHCEMVGISPYEEV